MDAEHQGSREAAGDDDQEIHDRHLNGLARPIRHFVLISGFAFETGSDIVE